jgi:hypothetical protein
VDLNHAAENWKPVRGTKGLSCSNDGRFRCAADENGNEVEPETVSAEMVAKAWLAMKRDQRVTFRDGNEQNWAVSNLQLKAFVRVTRKTKLAQEEITRDIAEQVLKYEPDTGRFFTQRTAMSGIVTWVHAGEVGVYYMVPLLGQKYRAQALAVLFMTGIWPCGPIRVKNLNWGDARWSNVEV